jgi:hypothetical protein
MGKDPHQVGFDEFRALFGAVWLRSWRWTGERPNEHQGAKQVSRVHEPHQNKSAGLALYQIGVAEMSHRFDWTREVLKVQLSCASTFF